MEELVLVQRGNKLHAKFRIKVKSFRTKVLKLVLSPEYIINNTVIFQIGSNQRPTHGSTLNKTFSKLLIFIRFEKACVRDTNKYILRLSSNTFGLKDNLYVQDDSRFKLIVGDYSHNVYHCSKLTFDLTVHLEIDRGSLSSFLDDTDFTDFQLKCEDGSISVHKFVLAASSPVLRRMLSENWRRETIEGFIEISSTTKSTLQDLKNYMYAQTIPEDDARLQQLLLVLLASYYIMPELEQLCIRRLVSKLNAQNALTLTEFAVKNCMTRLHLAILKCIQQGAVQVKEMQNVHLKFDRRDSADSGVPPKKQRRQ